MARKISVSQLKSKMRQAQQKQRQAISKVNQEIRRYNRSVKSAVDSYNREVRAHNAKVRANRQRIRTELARMNRQVITVGWKVTYRESTEALFRSYDRLETFSDSQDDPRYDRLLDLSEKEAANSLELANYLLGDQQIDEHVIDEPNGKLIVNLQQISPDLDARWHGALFALNPRNPDAARHFCTSSREIMDMILEVKAPDSSVVDLMPNCARTEKGKPTRRSKIQYILRSKGICAEEIEDFVDQDIENILQLFRLFNDGTHGSAGRFDMPQLLQIRKRVEHGIAFLTELAGNN